MQASLKVICMYAVWCICPVSSTCPAFHMTYITSRYQVTGMYFQCSCFPSSRLCLPIFKHFAILSIVFRVFDEIRFAKISRNWLRNDFRVSRNWGMSFAVSRNCLDYERNECRETRKSRKRRKLEVKIKKYTVKCSNFVIGTFWVQQFFSRKKNLTNHTLGEVSKFGV
jgi:hypothetical protein